jgi:aldehyde dehydrogenase (NAD+)
VEVIQGGVDVSKPTCTTLGLYFFTGSVRWKIVAQAAEHLTPVTLELGGKRIIDETANLKLAAKKELFGKIYECGTNLALPLIIS